MILDKGPWTITPQMELQSEDFTHDVIIEMNGDFEGLADRLRYLNALKDRLNEKPLEAELRTISILETVEKSVDICRKDCKNRC